MTQKGYLYSFDMLGEAARTEADALRYHKAYADAISSLDAGSNGPDIRQNHGISVKLSALHPRYEVAQKEEMLPVMAERLLSLALAAQAFAHGPQHRCRGGRPPRSVARRHRAGAGRAGACRLEWLWRRRAGLWPRAAFAIDWLYALAKKYDRNIMVRLVKGAYWDTEIKRAQTLGLAGYPVFTRKANTDVSYMACAKKLLAMTDRIYPQFATHNAHTVAAILSMAGNRRLLRVPAPAWHGRGAARDGAAGRRHALPHLCAGRRAFATCLPIWSAGCWRTAPIPPSCIS